MLIVDVLYIVLHTQCPISPLPPSDKLGIGLTRRGDRFSGSGDSPGRIRCSPEVLTEGRERTPPYPRFHHPGRRHSRQRPGGCQPRGPIPPEGVRDSLHLWFLQAAKCGVYPARVTLLKGWTQMIGTCRVLASLDLHLIVERRPRRQEARPRRPHRRPPEGTDPIRTRTRPDRQRLTARKIRVRPRRGTEQRITTARTRGDARRPEDRTRHTARRNRRSTRPGPAPGTSTLPDQARYTPILRANPCSEVTDQVCRLPLPTLFYRLEALNLEDLLRIWVRSGANFPRSPLPDFQGPRGRSGHHRNCGALRVPNPISLLKDSRELERL
ncbi:hypothetical protein J6590_007609 [Homalodisca vitripennis]|nr:hypothetical protein J6590_007609 [Homalodisca vitripennis]